MYHGEKVMKIISNIENWFAKSRIRMSLSHCLEGLIIQIPISLVSDFWTSALCVLMWYWSREKNQYEQRVKTQGASNVTVWTKGFFPWDWDKYSIYDLLFPVASSCLIALLVTILGNYIP